MSWCNPVNEGCSLYNEIRDIIEDIYFFLAKNNEEPLGESLFEGNIGKAIFLAYYSKFKNTSEPLEYIDEIVRNVFKDHAKTINGCSFAEGLSGVIWGLNHLNDIERLSELDISELSMFNEFLHEVYLENLKNNNYDLFYGAIGNLFAILYNDQLVSKDVLFHEFFDCFKKYVLIDTNGWRWKAIINKNPFLEGYNLGLAHGIPSLLSFLLNNSSYFETNSKCIKQITYGVLKYLSYIRNCDFCDLSMFPPFIIENNSKKCDNSRLGWCYGDLGIGITFWLAGNVLNNECYKRDAITIFNHSIKRCDLKENFVFDLSFCHGVSGIVHIYNRIYNYTLKSEYKVASVKWLEILLKEFIKDQPIEIWKDNITGGGRGLLTGLPGIGLVLISSISIQEPKWDKCLLLS